MDDLDPVLLEQARTALGRVAALERELDVAKADVRLAVRRLQLAGGSVRAIGKAVGLSHQRVQQLIDAVDDGRGWKRRGKAGAPLVCSFCGHDQTEVAKLIAGPNVFICDQCVAMARRVVDGAADGAWGRSEQACRFCGKRPEQRLEVVAHGQARICRECLDLCDEILGDQAANS